MCVIDCILAGIILVMGSANDRRLNIVTCSLIRWAHTQIDCTLVRDKYIILAKLVQKLARKETDKSNDECAPGFICSLNVTLLLPGSVLWRSVESVLL